MFKTHSVIRGILFIKDSLETETFENRLGQYIRPWGSQAKQHLIPAGPRDGLKGENGSQPNQMAFYSRSHR